MRYGSVCSGIEAATVAWHSLGWEPAFFSEIEKFPREVLTHHYLDVPLHGDFTTIGENQYGSIDLLVGGTPCQSFSVAGLRKGLDDDRGNLSIEFIKLAQRERPRWVVWENVPGVLSSNGGKDFGSFLGALGEIGYGFAYRVLDAQYFGVAQRRRRVFVVGYLGDWRRAAAVLFERESLRGNPAPSREKGQKPAPTVTAGPLFSRTGNDRVECDAYVTARMRGFGDYKCDGTASTIKARDYRSATDLVTIALDENTIGRKPMNSGSYDPQIMATINAADAEKWGSNQWVDEGKAILHPIALAENTIGRKPINGGNGDGFTEGSPMYTLNATGVHGVAQPIPFDTTQITSPYNYSNPQSGDPCHPLATGAHPPSVAISMAVRRLTPIECERLQGFPDGYTNIKDKCPDSRRYKALGNSMAVPVMKWIGERIQMVESYE